MDPRPIAPPPLLIDLFARTSLRTLEKRDFAFHTSNYYQRGHELSEVHDISWLLDDDGGGVAKVFIDHGAHTVEHRYVFKSFDELPDYVADSIREDGRTEGEITTTAVRSEKRR